MAEKPKILAIDDDPVVLRLLTDMLTSSYELQISKSPKEAMTLIEKHKPDLILLDIAIPVISGFEFLHYLRQSPKFRDLPVIIVSGYIETEFIMYAEHEGISGTVGKPINKEDLLKKIELAINPK